MKGLFSSIMGYVLCCLLLLLCYIFVPQQMSLAECIDDHSNSLPQRIVVFPRFAEEILFELVKPEQIIYVGHEYFKEGESYWPTMSVSRFCSGNIWQNSDEEEILSMNPDLIIFSSELQIDFSEIFPEIANSDVSLLFVDTPQNVDDIIELILLLGDTVKENERAISMVDKMTSSIDLINRIVDTAPEAEHINVALYGEPNPFYVINVGWVAARNLVVGCIFRTHSGVNCTLRSIINDHLSEEIIVYNFEIADYHTYYVGYGCILVHNDCKLFQSRRAAFREAKRDSNVPVTAQPQRVQPNYDKHDRINPGRQYVYSNTIIREDNQGHVFPDGGRMGPHFNASDYHYFWEIKK